MAILWNKAQLLAFAQRFQNVRRFKRWNMREMGAELGISVRQVQEIEKAYAEPQDRVLLRFRALELDVAQAREARRALRQVPSDVEVV